MTFYPVNPAAKDALQFGRGSGVQNVQYGLKKADFIENFLSNQLAFDFPNR
jgi:hypothetical protein